MAILSTLARQTDDDKLSDFYRSLAEFLNDLCRRPVPSFITNAPAITTARLVAAGEQKKKEKPGRPRGGTSGQETSIQVLDAIVKLTKQEHGEFIPIRDPVKKITELGISRGTFRSRRQNARSGNPWIERLKAEWDSLSHGPRHKGGRADRDRARPLSGRGKLESK